MKPQKYRFTAEFLLKDRSRYAEINAQLRFALKVIEDGRPDMNLDFMVLEKVTEVMN